jgi:hypothetical protein
MPSALTIPPSSPITDNAQSANQAKLPRGMRALPAPNHAETVAALRHLHAISVELRTLMKDPSFGKADMKSAIIDGAAKLVASRILTPSEAVQQLAQVPDRPFDQKKWIEQNYIQTMQAIPAVLSHHAKSSVGTGDYALENALHEPGNPDDHLKTIQGMMRTHYA